MKYRRIKVEDRDILEVAKEIIYLERTIERLSFLVGAHRDRLFQLIRQAFPKEYSVDLRYDHQTESIMVPEE